MLVGGWNRYYGKTLLTYKLREAILKGRLESRSQTLSADNQPEPWPDPTQAPRSYRYSNLATPYSDEAVVGVDQALMGGRLNLTYVRRDGEDEFAQETGEPDLDGNKPLVLNNNGSSRHEEYSAAWERNFGKHYVSINIVYQETNTSNESYDDKFDDLVDIERICLDADDNNKVISCSELTRRDYNRPWVANLTYSVKLPYNFSFTNFTKYRSGYVGLVANGFSTAEKTAANFPTEFTVTSYREEKQPESWIFDWKLDWRQNLFRSQGIQLSLEVYNVFNQKVPAGAETDVQTYEIGRQFWAGMEYYF
ncbi:MAG: hypothetical protein A2X84_07350 [Desulfuromonadaceae bacterium GWC2_58_13]|nr:MAG: hypothetical protein A2X84_07350 [Desulfuromonadaceae bacterium GWC2_58_13]